MLTKPNALTRLKAAIGNWVLDIFTITKATGLAFIAGLLWMEE